MLTKIKTPLPWLIPAAGMACATLAGAWRTPALWATALLYLFSYLRLARRAPLPPPVWLPLGSGLLVPLLWIFPWDRADFHRRLCLLLFFSLLLSLLALIRARSVWSRLAGRFEGLPRRKQAWLVFGLAQLAFTLGAVLLTVNGVGIAGDEPHYLAISHSLVKDGDFNLFNQYFRSEYRDFTDARELPAHGTFGIGYKRIYSYHLPGLSVTMAPFLLFRLPFALLYILIRAYLGLYGALLAVLVFLFAHRLWNSTRTALLAALLSCLTAPLYFYSIHIFPEVQAALLVLGALYLLLFPGRRENAGALLAGLLLGASLFWGLKYSLFLYLYVIGFAIHFCLQKKYRKVLLLLLFPILFQALFFFYLYHAYGTFSPQAIYYGLLSPEQDQQLMKTIFETITWRMRLETLLDYFLDQRDGLLLYSPLYLFAIPGLLLALKRFRRYRIHLLIALPAFLFIANHAFSTVRPGFCPQARYLVPALWALIFFALLYFQEMPGRTPNRILSLLSGYSLFVVGYQLLHPATLYQPTTHDVLTRPALMFQQWSSLHLNLPAWLPSFIKVDNSRHLPNLIFLVLVAAAAAAALVPRKRRGRAWIPAAAALFLVALLTLFPRPGLYNPTLVSGDAAEPYFLFEKSPFPRQEEGGKRLVQGSGSFAFLIGTPRRPDAARLSLASRSGAAMGVDLLYRDRLLEHMQLAPGESLDRPIPLPEGIRWQSLRLHPFRLRVSASAAPSVLQVAFHLGRGGER